MGTEHPSRPNYSLRPVATPFAAQQSTAFLSSGNMAGSEAPAFRPAPPSKLQPSHFPAGPFIGSDPPAVRPLPSSRSTELVRPPPPSSSISPSPSGFHQFPNSTMTFSGQVPPTRPSFPGPPAASQPIRPGPPSVLLQQQPYSVPMGSPLQSIKTGQAYTDFQAPVHQHFSSSGSSSQPYSPPISASYSMPGDTFPGYVSRQPNFVSQAPPMPPASYQSHQGGHVPPMQSTYFPLHQGAYARPPPLVGQQRGYAPGQPIPNPSSLYSGNQMQPHGHTPSMGVSQGLTEDFNSLSLGSVPGSFDAGVNTAALPRPLDGDVEPRSFAEMYPMNCSSRFLRLTTSGVPNSQSLASRWHLPLGAVVCPLAETPVGEEVPIVNFATTGIIRCRRCRAYVNPYVTFTDNVPGDYFAPLDATGRRVDLDQRPELIKGSVEFIAPAEYMVRPPMPSLYFFLIDVSISAVQSGMLEVMAQTIKACLDTLPGSTRTQIGFITCDSTIHFYNLKSSLVQPQMMVVSDLDDMFVPLPDDLLVNLSESRSVVEAFLDSLPSMFQENANVESAFGPALKAAFMVMSNLGGKLLIFQSNLPSLGVGRLRLRGDDSRVYGSDKEHSLRVPEVPFYKQMAADFTKHQIAVNVYAFSEKYTDIASLGTLAKYTGGQVYYYQNFHSVIHKDKFKYELTRDLSRETAWEAVMRIICGKGVRFTSYHGNFMLRSTDLIALPAVDCDKAYVAQFSLEETLLTTQTVYFQVALLYTSSSGERRIRVLTSAAPVVADLGEMYRLADTGAIVSLFSRIAIEKTLSSKLEDSRTAVQLRVVKALREYRDLYAVQHRLTGRMIYPESLKFLPLYALALCKSMPLRGGHTDVQLDERSAAAYTMMALPVKSLLKLLYPNFLRIDDFLVKASSQSEEFDIRKRQALTAESLDSRGLYIFDDGHCFVIWFGRSVSPDITRNLLGEDPAADYSNVILQQRDNDMSRKLMKMLAQFMESDPLYYKQCHLVRQGEQPREGFLLLSNLVEDKISGANDYGDWMLLLFRQVQQNT